MRPLAAAGPLLVHCVLDAETKCRTERYLAGIIEREGDEKVAAVAPTRARLTRREQEILELLADGHDQRTIAVKLHVSFITIRNHVQHILAKLGAHSIHAAVARYLLEGWPHSDQGPAQK